MAKPRMRERGLGHVSSPPRLTREEDGSVSQATLSSIVRYLEQIAGALNGGLRLSSGGPLGRAGNQNAQMTEFTTPGSADVEFSVPHSLGSPPEGYIVVLQDKAGSIYTSNFGGWDNQTVYFKSDATSMLANIILYK